MYLHFPWIIFILFSDAKTERRLLNPFDHHAQVVVLHNTPTRLPSVKGDTKILLEKIKEIYVAAFRLTDTKRAIQPINPIHLPKAIVEVYIKGLPGYRGLSLRKEYKVMIKKGLPKPYKALKPRLTKLLGVEKPNYVNIDYFNQFQVNKNLKIFGYMKPMKLHSKFNHLNYNEEPDRSFFTQLEYIFGVVAQVNPDKIFPNDYMDYYEINVGKVEELVKKYGKASDHIVETASRVLFLITFLQEVLARAYKGSVQITVISTDEVSFTGELSADGTPQVTPYRPANEHSREINGGAGELTTAINKPPGAPDSVVTPDSAVPPDSVVASDSAVAPDSADAPGSAEGSTPAVTGGDTNGMGVDEDDPDFPLRFNLIFWFVLMYIYVLIATIYFVMRMEPDKDSIIYRMSNTRTKKEH